METLRHKRSKVIDGTDIDSTSALDGFPAQPSPVLTRDIPKNANFSNFGSDSDTSSFSKTADEDKFLHRLGWRSSKRAFGTSIKKLMSDEMSIETELKRRSPSVIARLMGLDGLPLQQSSRKYQQKASPESHSEKKSSVENYRKRAVTYGQRSSKRSSKDEQRFKDVFEVSEMPNMGKHRYLSQINADNKVKGAEMSFIEQKFVDARCLFTDRRVPKSQEFDDTLEVLDSNQDLLLKYFEQPDSLFATHLNDLKDTTFRSRCAHSEFAQTYGPHNYENVHMEKKCGRIKMPLNYKKSHHQSDDGLPNNLHGTHAVCSSKSSYFQSRGTDQSAATLTRIVVLKPNIGKVKDAVKNVSSLSNSHDIIFDHSNHTDFSVSRTEKAGTQEKENCPNIHISKRHSKEPREIASEVTEKMKNSFNGGSMTSSSTFTGYVGACDFHGNESSHESEMRRTKWSNPHSSFESYVRKEATKRLSERWKLAHKSKEVDISSRGSTLAEMLAIPDKETLTPKFVHVIGGESIYDKKFIGNGPSQCVEPLGISSRDGWKDGCIYNLSSSKSLPASSPPLGRSTMSLCRKLFPGYNYMISSNASKKEKTRPKKGHDPKYGLWRHSKSDCRKSRCHCPTTAVTYESSPNMHTNQNKVKNSSGGSYLTDQDQDIVTDKLALSLKASIPALYSVENLEHGNGGDRHEQETELSPETSSSVTDQGESETEGKSNFAQQERLVRSSDECSISLQSPSSIKDIEHPSPVSVLEPSLTDDLSSCSDCFESLSAKLCGLRMQLQLLKFESEPYAEGSVLISSDEDGEEGSARNSDESRSCGIEDSWESSYIVDILTYAGLGDDVVHLDNSIVEWQSPGYSINPSLFDELEKKYSNVTSGLRSERRLLFDRVNLGLYDMHQQFMEPRPWVRPVTKLASYFITHVGKGSLPPMLANKERHGNKDTLEKVLAREIEWLDLKDEIHGIGREMEKLLINELIMEII